MGISSFTLCETLDVPAPERIGPGAQNRWAVQLVGEDDDVQDLARVMSEPSPTGAWAIDTLRPQAARPLNVVSSSHWDGIDDAAEVQAAAQVVLTRAVGWLNLLDGCRSIKVGTIYEFSVEGKCVLRRFSPQGLLIKKPETERLSPSLFLKLMNLSDSRDWLSACVVAFEGEPTFYKVYIAVEAIIRHCGDEKAMRARPDINGGELAKVKNVADFHRHFRRPNRQPPNPMLNLEDCIRILTEAVVKISAAEIGSSVQVVRR